MSLNINQLFLQRKQSQKFSDKKKHLLLFYATASWLRQFCFGLQVCGLRTALLHAFDTRPQAGGPAATPAGLSMAIAKVQENKPNHANMF